MPSNFTWRLIGDLQLGNVGVDLALVPRLLQPIRARKDYYGSILGDVFDRIGPKDKRFSFEDFDEKVSSKKRPKGKRGKRNTTPPENRAMSITDAPVDFLHDHLNTISDKMLSINIGNHELVNKEDHDPVRRICDELDIPYAGYRALVRINGEDGFLSQLWHGRPSIGSRIRDPLQRNLNVKRALVRTNVDVLMDHRVSLVAQGHTNQLVVVRPEESSHLEMEFDWQKNVQRATYKPSDPRWYACCGSIQRAFVHGRTTYVEAKGLSPLPLGCVDVEVRDSKIYDVRTVVLA